MADYSVYNDKKPLSLGIDRFDEIVAGEGTQQCYYVDKTMLIYEILNSRNKVILIPRPRRFGKSLNLDMLHKFLSLDTDPSLFNGLQISQHEDFCKQHQGKYPVLHIDLKTVEGESFEHACSLLARLLHDIALSLQYLESSPVLTKKMLKSIIPSGISPKCLTALRASR